jgi:hypothetical protein
LVRLRAPKADGEPVDSLGDIGHVEADQFAPTQRASEAKQEKCPVPTSPHVCSESLAHHAQLGHRERPHLALGGPKCSSYATAHQADCLLSGRTVVPGCSVGGTDSCQAKVDRGRLGDLGEVGHVQGHGLRTGGQGNYPVLLAPGGELRPAGAVDAGRVLGPTRSEVVPRVGDDLGQLGSLFGALEQRPGPSLFLVCDQR